VQRQFVDIDTSRQHRLVNLLSTIQRDVPPQPSRSYQHLAAATDSDTDDGFYLMSSYQSHAGISSVIISDDDDDDDSIDWEMKYDTSGSTVRSDRDQIDHACSAKQSLPGIKQEAQESAKQEASMYHACSAMQSLPDVKQEPRESVKQEANMYPVMDLTISSSDDEEMASFAAAFESQPGGAAAGWSTDTQTGENIRCSSQHVISSSSSENSDDSDDELTAAAWQRLHGNTGACKLKFEDTCEALDFIPLVNEPAAWPAETTGNVSSCCCCYCCYYCYYY